MKSLDENLRDYLDEIAYSDICAATLRNRTSYCEQFVKHCTGKDPELDPLQHVTKFCATLWLNRATESTIKSKLAEAIRFCRWLESKGRGSVGAGQMDTGTILSLVKQSHPNRR